ncbi:MAG: EAL domain-containing protein [Methyloversatilis sp.]|nr:EAL domain-containing protein [Methyloversatilis sp.]MBP6195516.1 EAL domain-containing protein [Methyloversatilis sp.]MBP9118651.1 EAL domain-containing protein [Methyloversatilis sp.]
MKLVIVDDSELIRNQLVAVIKQEPRIEIAGQAAEEEEAVRLIMATAPDAVLLDLSLAPGSGVRVLERIRAAGSGARVLILTNSTGSGLRQMCKQLGANGFFDKTRELDTCFDTLFGWLPPLPDNEARRLEQLHAAELLDTPEHEAFDNLTRLAAEITDVPVALISLLDKDRQWFLSHTGTDVRETSRSIAFCAHTILRSEMMEVCDALEDERFRDNPLVTGDPNIRFYAGVPLILPSGEALGTLCVIDRKPRHLSTKQRLALKTLASSAITEIELRRRIIFLEEEGERRRMAEAHIQHLATRDPLTGLPNRATFRDRLDQHVLMATRREARVGVLFIDLDRFKPINDTLGHDVGDDALVIIAERLNRCLRGSDTIARLGGDEFAIVLPDAAGETEVLNVAAKIVKALEESFTCKGFPLHLSASVGAAIFPEHGRLGDELLRHADLAMYQAKQDGGAQVCLYSKQMSDRAEEMQALDGDLREAIRRGTLFLHFQPQVLLDRDVLCGVEALVRWQHPHYGMLPPSHFIPLAEQRGFIHELTRLVLDLALTQMKAWDEAGLHVPRIAVNVSPAEIRNNFTEMIEAALFRHGMAPQRLELEITETVLTSDGIETMRILQHLRALGVGIAVDDFGVGYSSLAQLHRLPIDSLKIDRSFLDAIDTSVPNTAIVRAIVTMADAMGLRTVAEGVETESQRGLLRQLGCLCAQGYLVARPMPAPDATHWLRCFLKRRIESLDA